jgi:hypothetical protein
MQFGHGRVVGDFPMAVLLDEDDRRGPGVLVAIAPGFHRGARIVVGGGLDVRHDEREGKRGALDHLNYPRFSSYSVARAGVGWLAVCEVPVRATSYSAGGM